MADQRCSTATGHNIRDQYFIPSRTYSEKSRDVFMDVSILVESLLSYRAWAECPRCSEKSRSKGFTRQPLGQMK